MMRRTDGRKFRGWGLTKTDLLIMDGVRWMFSEIIKLPRKEAIAAARDALMIIGERDARKPGSETLRIALLRSQEFQDFDDRHGAAILLQAFRVGG